MLCFVQGIEFDDQQHLGDLPTDLKLAGFLVRASVSPYALPIASNIPSTVTDNTPIWYVTTATFHLRSDCNKIGKKEPTTGTYQQRGKRNLCGACSW